MTQKNNSTSYKSLISNLEKIIKDLESNKASIDKSIDLYQKGMNLVVECEKKLLNIEKNTSFKNTSKKSLPKKFKKQTTTKMAKKMAIGSHFMTTIN